MTVVRRRSRAGVVTAAALLLSLVLASCTSVSGIVRTQRALSSAGFREASVSFTADGDSTVLRIGYRTQVTDVPALAAEYAEAARVVWLQAPLRFDAVVVTARSAPGSCVGDCTDRFDRATLAEQHGPRDPGLDKDIGNEMFGIGLAVMAVMALAAIVLIALVVRSRRRAKRVQPWGYPPGQGGPGYGPPGWGVPPPTAPTPYQSAPGYAPPPPGYLAPPAAPPAGWPPSAPPPELEPPPMPTHDIWERPPS